ncbi:hypothetical protein CKO42_16385 [Lamprobacter modestohalophilus]|uniref:Uncharacterized protein n=1 Tax=Lamprobacter modestohalophilus TaxID=1064514 RepID=A0A9X0WAP3_9GAMM|nr:hypothetical protein [Lamprobacter modestohalophilus]MBK1619989.1 hypothetical protein [Lamprobacter modestohalophilus]
MDAIIETDPTARAEYLKVCASNPSALAWTLAELAKLPAQSPQAGNRSHHQTPTPKVCCRDCRHFVASSTSPAAGLGRCSINAPASNRAPALWPAALHHCRDWRPITEGDTP